MKSKYLTYLFIFILVSCSEDNIQEEKKEKQETIIPFELSEDYHLFSKKLNINDSIKFHFDLAVCEGTDHAYLTFIRTNEGIKLNSYLKGEYTDTSFSTLYPLEEFNLDSVISNGITDSLLKLQIPFQEKRFTHTECEISFNNDTVFLQDTTGLLGKLKHIQRFESSLSSLYSDIKGFARFIIPEPIDELK